MRYTHLHTVQSSWRLTSRPFPSRPKLLILNNEGFQIASLVLKYQKFDGWGGGVALEGSATHKDTFFFSFFLRTICVGPKLPLHIVSESKRDGKSMADTHTVEYIKAIST